MFISICQNNICLLSVCLRGGTEHNSHPAVSSMMKSGLQIQCYINKINLTWNAFSVGITSRSLKSQFAKGKVHKKEEEKTNKC